MYRRPPRSPLFPYTTLSRSHDERRVHEPVVFRESRTRRLSRLQGLEDDARGEDSRLDRVVDALERRHVHETGRVAQDRSEEHTSELQSPCNLVCRLLLEKKN